MKKVISVILSVATLLSIVAMPMAVQTGGEREMSQLTQAQMLY